MPVKPERAPLEKKNGPVSETMWQSYTKIRGNAVKREMLENLGYLMNSDPDTQKIKVAEIAKKASYEAKQALNLK